MEWCLIAGGNDGQLTSGTPDDLLHGLVVQVVRSKKRRRTISARLDSGRLILQVPAGLDPAEERAWAEKLGLRLLKARRRQTRNDDRALLERAQSLNQRFFDGRLQIRAIRYVTNQQKRFGSCTPSQGTIRIADRVATLPPWVRDAVIVHELAHLVEANHSARFWKLANAYPLMERARGYLMALGADEFAADESEADESEADESEQTSHEQTSHQQISQERLL